MGYWRWLIHKFRDAYSALRLILGEYQSFQQDLRKISPAIYLFARCFIALVGGFVGITCLARLISSWPYILKFAIIVIAAFFWLSYLVYALETYLEGDP